MREWPRASITCHEGKCQYLTTPSSDVELLCSVWTADLTVSSEMSVGLSLTGRGDQVESPPSRTAPSLRAVIQIWLL